MIEFVDLGAQRRRIGDRMDRAIARVLEHGAFIMGPEVFELEEQLAGRCRVRHAISCSSGTDALLLALLAWGVGPGDAVFVPAFTFAATAEVVALVGAAPVFVDVEESSFNLDVVSLREAVAAVGAEGRRPAGVIAVDLFGQPAPYEEISAVTAEHGMWLLADAAQSFGATGGGRPVGALADVTATSFFPAKPLGCYGDGGAVFTHDDDLARTLRSLRIHGQGNHKYDTVRIGINGRLDTIQAAVLLEKLRVFDEELELRQAVAARYTKSLEGLVQTPSVEPGARSAWAQYTVRVNGRDGVIRALSAAGVPSAVYYPTPLHRQPAYEKVALVPVDLSRSEAASASVLSLPMHPYLSETAQDRVAAALAGAVGAG